MNSRTRRLLIAGGMLAAAWLVGLVLLVVFAVSPSREVLFALAATGAVVLLAGISSTVLVFGAIRTRERARGTQLKNLERRIADAASAGSLNEAREALQNLTRHLDEASVQAGALKERADSHERTVAALGSAIDDERSTRADHAVALEGLERRTLALDDVARRVPPIDSRLESLEGGTRVAKIEARLGKLEARIAASPSPEVMSRAATLVDALVAVSARQGLTLADVVSPSLAAYRVAASLERNEVLTALPYLDEYPSLLHGLTNAEARRLLRELRRMGYLSRAVPVIEELARRMQKPADLDAARIFASELALYEGRVEFDDVLPTFDGDREGDVVVHVVGKALPETQSGYTLRTQYTVEAQQRAGIRPIVAVHSGSGKTGLGETRSYVHQGVPYYELAGPERGRAQWDEWLKSNINALAGVVREVRPAILHAHSDFMNVLVALPVARAYGIPLVNETRGFWEESWLSRAATAEGWDDLVELERSSGLPDMYRLRVEREAEARGASDAVVTLARVMEQHIDSVGKQLGVPVPPVWLAPNAVDAAGFAATGAEADLRASLGIEPTTRVVGYISSIVEYEGIDTLVRAVSALGDESVRLLVVGDGPELGPLRDLAAGLGLTSAIFTGRVPHEQVLDYYALIDLFVVPRKPVTVTELVTPLKPFEAMAAGLPCLFSDVGALAEIAEDSGAAALFRAGDPDDLARRLRELLADPAGLEAMGARGLSWVSKHRTWDVNAGMYLELYRSLGADAPEREGAQA